MITDTLICLRAVEPSDIHLLYDIENDNAPADLSPYPAPVSRYMIEQYIAAYTADFNDAGELRLIIARADDGLGIGTLDITDYDRRNRHAYVGIAVLPQYRRQGFAFEALSLLCSVARDRFGLHQLAAIVAADNDPSMRLFRKAGFKSCGRLRSWISRAATYADAIIFQRLFP